MHVVWDSSKHWAIILAGGDGTRLARMTHIISGDHRPKQFCSILGSGTLLRQTIERISPLFARNRMMFLLNRSHHQFYSAELDGISPGQLLVQPGNCGTAPAIALAVLEASRRQPEATLAFFPSDHFYRDDGQFRKVVSSALRVANTCSDSIVMIGAEARYPETDYGWIEKGAESGRGLFEVARFREKPRAREARRLWKARELWNTFVMVGHVRAFRERLEATVPDLLSRLEDGIESGDLQCAYDKLAIADFSALVLSRPCGRLFVLCDKDSGWTDVGTPARILEAMIQRGIEPHWAAQPSEIPRARAVAALR